MRIGRLRLTLRLPTAYIETGGQGAYGWRVIEWEPVSLRWAGQNTAHPELEKPSAKTVSQRVPALQETGRE